MSSFSLAILPIFVLIIFGFLLKKWFIKNEGFWKKTDYLVYYFLFPCLIISKLAEASFNVLLVTKTSFLLILSSLIVAIFLIFLQKIKPFENKLFTSVFQGSLRFNSYIFIALAYSLYSEAGLNYALVIASFLILFLNFSCVGVLSFYAQNQISIGSLLKAISKNPLIISVVIGSIINLLNISINEIIDVVLKDISKATLPLSLIAVGAGLKFAIGKSRWLAVIISSILKLLVLPIVAFLILNFFKIGGSIYSVAMLYTTIPCASSAYILARQMGGDDQAMASIITITTLFSMITMPLILHFI